MLAKQVPEWRGDGDLWVHGLSQCRQLDRRNDVAMGCAVFVRYLLQQDLANRAKWFRVATRAGLREATALPDGRIRVEMGPVSVEDRPVCVQTADGKQFGALTRACRPIRTR